MFTIKTTMLKKGYFCALFFIALFIAAQASPLHAAEGDGPGGDGGDHEIHIYYYHDYYIPFVPGMDNCYGAYRMLASRGYQAISTLSLKRTTTAGKLPGAENVTIPTITDHTSMHSDARELYRDDIIVFTSFHPSATITIPDDLDYSRYPYVIHNIRTYHFEVPVSFAGMMADLTPTAGSQAADIIGRPWTIGVDDTVAKKYMDSFSIMQFVPNYKPNILAQYGHRYEDNDDRTIPRFRKSKVVPFKDYEKSDPAGKDKNVYAFVVKKFNDPKNPKANRWGSYSGSMFRNRQYHFYYILMLNPHHEANVDMVGWWSLYSADILNSVDNMRKEPRDQQQEYDRDSAKEAALIPPSLKAADSWESIKITFSKDAFKDYTYDTVLSSRKPYGVWRWPEIPGYKKIYRVWNEAADRIEDEMRAAKKAKRNYSIPLNPSYQLSAFQSTSPGYWVPPKASALENKLMSVYSNDPKYIGFAPYARATASLYFSRDLQAPTFAGTGDPYKSMSAFLGTGNIGPTTDFRNAFYSRVRSPSFQSGGWNDPWLPYMAQNGDIWSMWYKKDPVFYKNIVPLMALDTGMALWDIPGVTAWNIGVQRNRGAKLIAEINTPVNTTVGFSPSVQTEMKGRNYGEEAYYQDRAGKTQRNHVAYIGDFKKQKLTDFGSVKLQGSDSQKYMTPLSVRYFPVDTGKIPQIRNTFTFLGHGIKLPSYSEHSEMVWDKFPLPSAAASGLNTAPPVW